MLRLINWNVEGLLSKMIDPDFTCYLRSFSIICLTETFLVYFDNENIFPDYDCFISPAQKLSHQGRHSGGVMCLVKKTISRFFKLIDTSAENILVLCIDRQLFGLTTDVYLFVVYLPPVGSPFYESKESNDGTDLLEKCMLNIEETHGSRYFMVCGDFNARTGNLNTNPDSYNFSVQNEMYECERDSHDRVINTFGRSLLALCVMFELCIVNGLSGQFSERFTFVSGNGSSVIDYFIVSADLIDLCRSLNVAESSTSSHMPVEVELVSQYSSTTLMPDVQMSKIVWKRATENIYVENLLVALSSADIDLVLATQDVDSIVKTMTTCLTESAEFLRKTFRQLQPNHGHRWYDKECNVMKRAVRSRLRKFQSTSDKNDRLKYVKYRNEYKLLLRRKKGNFMKNVTESLIDNLRNSEMFWKTLKTLRQRRRIPCPIEPERWVEHFQEVYTEPEDRLLQLYDNIKSPDDVYETDCLNERICEKEVLESIKKLKGGKAGGVDGVMVDMMKCSVHVLKSYLVRLFNCILDTGNFPRTWSESIIVPIYKRGDRTDPDNYRGITITSIFSKVFLHIVQDRIDQWLNTNDVIVEEQAGFRKGYSTIDNIFVLNCLVNRHLTRKKKLYVAFIDFKKAFDSVSRLALWNILEKYGFSGKISQVLRSIYNEVKCCVRTENAISEFFPCFRGLKQGCKCSPKIFSIVINTLATEIKDKCKHGVQIVPNTPEISVLLFADDIVLFSDTVIGLQNQIDILHVAASRLGLSVNLQKTKVMIFRKGGHIAAHEHWQINGQRLEVVNEYKYLGHVFTTKMSTNVALVNLAARGKAAVNHICKTVRKLSFVMPDLFFKMFECQILPILLYGSEIWGLNNSNIIETVHLYSLKQFLNVSVKTPNVMVYGDTGRYPLAINAAMRVVRYWLKILKMDKDRLPRRVYEMLLKNMEIENNWAYKLSALLKENGCEEVWENQKVESESSFLCYLKDSLINKFIEQWMQEMNRSSRYEIYRSFKQTLEIEAYLYKVDKKVFREVLVKFRFGISDLYIHKHRYDVMLETVCPLCQEEDEDEYHILIRCPAVSDLRLKYILPHVIENGNLFEYLMRSEEQTILRALSTYLYHVLKRRESAIN